MKQSKAQLAAQLHELGDKRSVNTLRKLTAAQLQHAIQGKLAAREVSASVQAGDAYASPEPRDLSQIDGANSPIPTAQFAVDADPVPVATIAQPRRRMADWLGLACKPFVFMVGLLRL
jgi:hypothetical protein